MNMATYGCLKKKPFKKDNHWTSSDGDCEVLINSDWFPEVKWEDEEPRELILKQNNYGSKNTNTRQL